MSLLWRSNYTKASMEDDGTNLKGGVYSPKISRIFRKRVETTAFLFIVFIFIGTLVLSRYVDVYSFAGSSFQKAISHFRNSEKDSLKPDYYLNCTREKTPQTCSNNPTYKLELLPSEACPHYFHWIQEDLMPWKNTGITKEMVENAKKFASIRIIIVNGTVYVKRYRHVYQTRDVFTIWGILQLLRLYPGQIPDLDIMYQMDDKPSMKKSDYTGENAAKKPPLFHFCADNSTFDIVFPDWSFWGWPEINIGPWNKLKKELEEGNKRKKWMKRKRYAYWKGNLDVGERSNLRDCDITKEHDWNARIYGVSWGHESQKGFKGTKLANQCNYRYKIYIEGNAWSVSEKYIVGCGSMSLFVQPRYHDFFSRSLVPTIHYWPINKEDKCKSIKFAVDWGNKNTEKAQKIGAAGSRFMQEDLDMTNVYDYMYHLLRSYAKLLKYKPTVPEGAEEMCMENMACNAPKLQKQFMVESMVKFPSYTNPCSMPTPYNASELHSFFEMKENLTKQVEMWQTLGRV